MHQAVLCFGVGEPSSRFTSKLVAAVGSGLPYLQNWVALEAGWFVTDALTLSQGGCEKACHHPALGQARPLPHRGITVHVSHLVLLPHSPEHD